jgi:hypothetical protein
MLEMKAFLNEDDTQVALRFPEMTLTLNAEDLEDFIIVLVDVRSRLLPQVDDDDDCEKLAANLN